MDGLSGIAHRGDIGDIEVDFERRTTLLPLLNSINKAISLKNTC